MDDIKITFDETEDIKTTLDVGSIQYGQLEIGTTTTGETGEAASVTNTGSSSHAILNFTIPRGEKGDKGDKGDTGETIKYIAGTNIEITEDNVINNTYDDTSINNKLNGKEAMGSIVVEDITCKNLFNTNDITSNVTITKDGTIMTSSVTNVSGYILVKAGQQYTFSYNYTSLLGSVDRGYVFYDLNKTYLSGDVYNPASKKITITPTKDGYVRIGYDKNCYDIQLEKGNKATDYTSYKKIGYNSTDSMGEIVVDDIKCKNDFPLLNNYNSAGISITSNGDGTYNVSGTATANVECVLFKNIKDTIIENGGTYTLSANQSLPTGVNSRIEFFNNGSYVGGYLTVINGATNRPTATANTTGANQVRFGLFITSGTTVNITNLGLQLEKGSVATGYVEHKEFGNNRQKVLWTNPSPSSEFAGQTVTLNETINNFDMYKVFCKRLNSYNETLTFEAPKGLICYMDYCVFASSSSAVLHNERTVNISGTKCTFGDAKRNGATSNTNLIPLYVIGYKTGLFK